MMKALLTMYAAVCDSRNYTHALENVFFAFFVHVYSSASTISFTCRSRKSQNLADQGGWIKVPTGENLKLHNVV